MAITTLDGIIAGFQPPVSFFKQTSSLTTGVPSSLYGSTGYPGAAANPSSGLTGANITSRAGQLYFNNPGSGNTYMARLEAVTTNNTGVLMLVDRIWDNSGITVTTTTGQTVTTGTLPARDNTGTTTGVGYLFGLEAIAAMGNGSISNTTITYTGTVNGASQTGSLAIPFPASAPKGTFVPFTLAAGDTGVASVQTLTLGTSYVSGTLSLVGYRILATLPLSTAGSGAAIDALTGGMVQMYNNTCPFLIFIPSTTTTTSIIGQLIYTQG